MSDSRLPHNVRTWKTAMAKLGLTGQTIYGAEVASASKMEYKHFLLLRVLWKHHDEPDGPDLPQMLTGINEWMSEAHTMLKKYKSWNTYCQGFTLPDLLEVKKTEDKVDPATFETPIARRTRGHRKDLDRKLADMHLETPSKSTNISGKLDIENIGLDDPLDIPETPIPETPSPKTPSPETPRRFQERYPTPKELEKVLYPPTKDEQIVNCALVIFLNALTIHFKLANSWTLHRKAFKATFEETSFEARIDGYLDDGRGNAQVIIEVKPVRRSKKLSLIQMQESAQMVAWIRSDDEKPSGGKKMRLHISQDRHEIFLTVAEYDDDYIKYLGDKNHRSESLSFMTMHQFGPWDTQDPNHMKYLGPLLLAITLRAEAESKKNKS